MKAKIQLPACYKKEAEAYIAKLEAESIARVHEEVMKERQDIALRSLYLCLLACYQVGLKPSTLVKIQNAMSGPVTEKYSSYRVDQLADNGDRAYGTVEDTVFILTCDEYRKYRDYIPHYDSWIWTATPWGCGDKDCDTGYAYANNVRGVNVVGLLSNDAAYLSNAVAPACVLNPKFLNLHQNMKYVEEVSE